MYVRVCLIVYAYIRRLMDGSKSKMQAIDIRSTIKMFCLHRWRHLLDRKDKKKKNFKDSRTQKTDNTTRYTATRISPTFKNAYNA